MFITAVGGCEPTHPRKKKGQPLLLREVDLRVLLVVAVVELDLFADFDVSLGKYRDVVVTPRHFDHRNAVRRIGMIRKFDLAAFSRRVDD